MTTPHFFSQLVMRCDVDGAVLGTVPRREAHTAPGVLHLAVMVIVRDGTGRCLLQRRRHRLWDGRHDLGCATHVLALPSGNETPEVAAARCLTDEWSLTVPLTPRGAFVYHAFDVGGVEREHCLVFEARDNGSGTPHPHHAYGQRWVEPAALRAEIERRPLDFTPWTRRALAFLSET